MRHRMAVLIVVLVAVVICFVSAALADDPQMSTVVVTVNSYLPVDEMVADGKYDFVSDSITTAHFPITGGDMTETEIALFHFGSHMSTKAVRKELGRRGYRAARIEELLALGEQYPDLQREHPIVAFGSVWQHPDGCRHCPCLGGDASYRTLYLLAIDFDWSGVCRFAAVRK